MGQAKRIEEELIEEIIEKEARVKELELQTREYNRQLQHIKRSKTYRLAKPLESIKQFFAKIFRRDSETKLLQHIRLLEADINSLQEQLNKREEELHYLSLDKSIYKSYEMMEQLRQKKLKGELVNFAKKLVEQKREHVSNYNEALTYAARLFMQEDPRKRDLVYSQVLPAFQTDEIPEFMMRPDLLKDQPLAKVGSFRGSLSRRIRQRQLSKTELPEYILEDKLVAYEFIDQLKMRRPKTKDKQYTGLTVPKEPRTVIKPVDGAGSRGVYLIYDESDIIDVRRSKKLSSLAELEESMAKDLAINWVEEDHWMVEELILEDYERKLPARDLKFYSFYGEVGLILEIQRVPEVRQCWWTADGKRIRTGKYEESLFKGIGVTEEELSLAKDLSALVPAPFIRLDFLKSEKGLVFGEFTAKPGNYDEFNEEIDSLLGDYYLKAEAKLTEDLLSGKRFRQFNAFLDSLEQETDKFVSIKNESF